MLLEDKLSEHFRIHTETLKALKRLKIETVEDLLYHFPARYGDVNEIRSIASLQKGDEAVIFGKIFKLETKKAFRKRIPMAEAWVEDDTGKIKLVWFNQPYIAKMFSENGAVRLEGKVTERRGELYFSNPKIEKAIKIPVGGMGSIFGKEGEEHSLYPVYRESRGLTSNWIYHALQKAFGLEILEKMEDPIPENIRKKYNLPSLKSALVWIHAPRKRADAEAARKRFAFEEIFFIQLDRAREKTLSRKEPAFLIKGKAEEVRGFAEGFPFPLTNAQKNAINAILEDFKKGRPMSRLLEGDVGSGKTAVAAATAFAVVTTLPPDRKSGNLQVAYMAPTEILAEQHFHSFIEHFGRHKLQVGLITGSGCKKFPSKVKNPSTSSGQAWTDISRSQLLKWVENGEIPILIGTHSLIQKTVKFKNLAYIIIDEQHRFGVKQRQALRRKHDITPHLLSMTATPIPRTLALTLYGDLDLTVLDELPAGRKPVVTELVLPQNRQKVYEEIRREIKSGRQAYVICPRIDEPDLDKQLAVNAKSVKEEAKRLKEKIFPEFEIATLTGKTKSSDKEKTMLDFKLGKADILVATSVVEVGVNVPNATVIIIEGAERFGLAQLHQLRGRVLRSTHQAYAYVFTESSSGKTIERLKALSTAKNGFELAEKDLQQRGAGDLSGVKQWGVSDLAMDALKNIKMVEAARAEAQALVEKDFELKKYPLLKQKILAKTSKIHLE